MTVALAHLGRTQFACSAAERWEGRAGLKLTGHPGKSALSDTLPQPVASGPLQASSLQLVQRESRGTPLTHGFGACGKKLLRELRRPIPKVNEERAQAGEREVDEVVGAEGEEL